jgi:L-ascorbate metabolism protein UlaG (beta-lactamase superfamily)
MRSLFALLFTTGSLFSAQGQVAAVDVEKAKGGEISIQPVRHASLILKHNNKNLYIDPTGGAEAYKGVGAPDMIIVTDIHGDHFDAKTIDAVKGPNTVLIVPQAVADLMPASNNKQKVVVVANGEMIKQQDITIEALPMYNLPETDDSRHPKGRGNGYVLTIGGKRIYISGDTEDIPEMRALQNIDIAFVCMNLPYTMDVNQAAQGVMAFKPKVVYPYHHRGQDINVFAGLVNAADKKIEVRLRNWYPGAK